MDKFRQKSRKEKPTKNDDRDKASLFITDVKTIKENLKIKEILRTVKMNSSMRIKAPRGSKVMQNKDFNDNDNDDIFEDTTNAKDLDHDLDAVEMPSAINPDVIINDNNIVRNKEELTEDDVNKLDVTNTERISDSNENNCTIEITTCESPEVPEGLLNDVFINQEKKRDISSSPEIVIDLETPSEYSPVKTRDRKLSLDQTMLSRREGLSQSELDLHSIGKSPLERKSSFFRKKMDSFLKNTTEIFRRQSISKSQSSIQRRGSMSVSLQSLNEDTACNGDFDARLLREQQEKLQGSVTSLRSSVTGGRSVSSLSQSDRAPASPDIASFAGSQPALGSSQPLGGYNSNSIHSLNEAYIQESLLNSRAISMSSGLDSAHGQDRRKANRSNRVTWLASEGLTNYLRRVIQDEKSREMQMCHSFQDFSSIPESNPYGSKTDSKGRRLSYQRAVSGEDPVTRYQDNSLRRKAVIPENSEVQTDLDIFLDEYAKTGPPHLQGFYMTNISDESFGLLQWAAHAENLDAYIKDAEFGPEEAERQAVIQELIYTEANYIRYIMYVVDTCIAVAHALQNNGKMLYLDTERLFSNIPDVLNANLHFWMHAFTPMLIDAMESKKGFNTEFLAYGFYRFRELFHPYEKYVSDQNKITEYMKSITEPEFMVYLTWCQSQMESHRYYKNEPFQPHERLHLSDILVKPMQRLTKYSIILSRIITCTKLESEINSLRAMNDTVKAFTVDLNRSIRQRDELETMDQMTNIIEPYEIDIKDEDLRAHFDLYAQLNLKRPMLNCAQDHSRTLVFEGDLRLKDFNMKESEVRVFIFTDLVLICKKLPKGSFFQYKVIRPKYMIYRLIFALKQCVRNNKETLSILFAVMDELGSSYHAFSLLDTLKEPKDPKKSLKICEQKLREARRTYEIIVWLTKNPTQDLSDLDIETTSDNAASGRSGLPGLTKPGTKPSVEDKNIERDARERVATMLHRSVGASTEYDYSQISTITDSFDGEASFMSGRPHAMQNLRYPMKRNSTGGSSRNSRLSSFQQSTSAASNEEQQSGPSRHRAGTSVEHVITPLSAEEGVTSITVNVVSDSESVTVAEIQQQPPTPRVVLQHSSPHKSPLPPRSSSANRNTLQVQPQNVVVALVHSLPDLTVDQIVQQPKLNYPQTASEQLYRSHQEVLLRKRIFASQQGLLKPNQRGSSYPPSSPTRASLKRGLAFSYSFKNPPLLKMGHVNSQSQLQSEAGPSTHQGFMDEIESVNPMPGTSSDTVDNKAKAGSSGQKGDDSSSGQGQNKVN